MDREKGGSGGFLATGREPKDPWLQRTQLDLGSSIQKWHHYNSPCVHLHFNPFQTNEQPCSQQPKLQKLYLQWLLNIFHIHSVLSSCTVSSHHIKFPLLELPQRRIWLALRHAPGCPMRSQIGTFILALTRWTWTRTWTIWQCPGWTNLILPPPSILPYHNMLENDCLEFPWGRVLLWFKNNPIFNSLAYLFTVL